jgi:hypothetical protein
MAMRVLTKLCDPGPVPLVLNTPALPDQKQPGCRAGAHAGEEQVSADVALSIADQRVGDDLHDPGTAQPIGLDVLLRFS